MTTNTQNSNISPENVLTRNKEIIEFRGTGMGLVQYGRKISPKLTNKKSIKSTQKIKWVQTFATKVQVKSTPKTDTFIVTEIDNPKISHKYTHYLNGVYGTQNYDDDDGTGSYICFFKPSKTPLIVPDVVPIQTNKAPTNTSNHKIKHPLKPHTNTIKSTEIKDNFTLLELTIILVSFAEKIDKDFGLISECQACPKIYAKDYIRKEIQGQKFDLNKADDEFKDFLVNKVEPSVKKSTESSSDETPKFLRTGERSTKDWYKLASYLHDTDTENYNYIIRMGFSEDSGLIAEMRDGKILPLIKNREYKQKIHHLTQSQINRILENTDKLRWVQIDKIQPQKVNNTKPVTKIIKPKTTLKNTNISKSSGDDVETVNLSDISAQDFLVFATALYNDKIDFKQDIKKIVKATKLPNKIVQIIMKEYEVLADKWPKIIEELEQKTGNKVVRKKVGCRYILALKKPSSKIISEPSNDSDISESNSNSDSDSDATVTMLEDEIAEAINKNKKQPMQPIHQKGVKKDISESAKSKNSIIITKKEYNKWFESGRQGPKVSELRTIFINKGIPNVTNKTTKKDLEIIVKKYVK